MVEKNGEVETDLSGGLYLRRRGKKEVAGEGRVASIQRCCCCLRRERHAMGRSQQRGGG